MYGQIFKYDLKITGFLSRRLAKFILFFIKTIKNTNICHAKNKENFQLFLIELARSDRRPYVKTMAVPLRIQRLNSTERVSVCNFNSNQTNIDHLKKGLVVNSKKKYFLFMVFAADMS